MPPKKTSQPGAGSSKKTQEKKKEKIIEVSEILKRNCALGNHCSTMLIFRPTIRGFHIGPVANSWLCS